MIGRVNTGGGGSGGVLTVTAPEGSTIEVSKGTRKYTKSGGVAVFKGLETGTWTVTIKKDGLTATQQIEIDADYELTIAYFTATIAVTFPTDCTSVTCTKGDTVLSVPSGSLASGKHTFSVHEAGEWTVSCTNGTNTASKVVSITTQGQVASVTLSYEIDLINSNDITGGWSVGYKQNTTPTIAAEADKITVSCKSTNQSYEHVCTAVTKNLIDLSGCTKITVNVTDVNILSAGDIRIGLVKNRTDSSLISSVKITAKKEYSLSITPGSYYVAIYVKGDIAGAEVTKASNITVNKLIAS